MTDAHPRMALGTMHLGTRLSATQSRETLDTYLDLGGQWIDAANCYAFWGAESGLGGQSKTVIGQRLADYGVCDQARINTKVGVEPTCSHGLPGAVEGLGRETASQAIRDSLQRPQTKRADLYWAHMEDREQPVADVAETFGVLADQELTARIGLPNHPAWYAATTNVHAQQRGSVGPSALQLRESYLHPRPDIPAEGEDHPHRMMTIESKDLAKRCGLDLWVYTPLLTGVYEYPERPLPEIYRHSGTDKWPTALRTWLEHFAMKQSQVVLALLSAQQPTITPIVDVNSVAQLTDAVEATCFSLPQEAVGELNAAGQIWPDRAAPSR